MLHSIAECCSMLQCAAACCSVLQRVAICHSVFSVLQCVLQRVLQRVAYYCSVLQSSSFSKCSFALRLDFSFFTKDSIMWTVSECSVNNKDKAQWQRNQNTTHTYFSLLCWVAGLFCDTRYFGPVHYTHIETHFNIKLYHTHTHINVLHPPCITHAYMHKMFHLPCVTHQHTRVNPTCNKQTHTYIYIYIHTHAHIWAYIYAQPSLKLDTHKHTNAHTHAHVLTLKHTRAQKNTNTSTI